MSTMTMRNTFSKRGSSSNTLYTEGGSTAVEMEQFAKAVYTSLSKVINNKELPPKQKHIRVAVMSTHREKGASTYWGIVLAMGLQSHDVTAYKFCLVTHSVLRDGHPNALLDSLRHIPFLDNLSRLWSNMADGYGRTTAFYCDLLVNKLKFHERNPLFPGSLQFENIKTFEEEYDTHPDNLYSLCAELFDYLEATLTLQAQIFKVVERGRWGTAAAQSQCFLAPLVPLIQDACQLYDLLVRSMYKLHSTLSVDMLQGHLERFKQLFPVTKTFFAESARLTYVKSFMHLPSLNTPPDFSKVAQSAASRQQHYAPVEIIKQPNQDQSLDYDYYYEDDSSINGGTLIDIQGTEPPPPVLPRSSASSSMANVPKRKPPEVPPLPAQIDFLDSSPVSPSSSSAGAENKKVLEELRAEVNYLMGENELLRSRQQEQENEMNREINEIQERFVQLKTENQSLNVACVEAETRAGSLEVEAEEQRRMFEEKLRASVDKFNKISDIYAQLRQDHLKTLRAKGELQKQLNSAVQSSQVSVSEGETRARQQLEEEVESVRMRLSEMQKQLAEMEETSQQQMSMLSHSQQQLTDSNSRLAAKELQISLSTQLIAVLFESTKESVLSALDVENPSIAIPIERSDELTTVMGQLNELWAALFDCSTPFDRLERVRVALRIGDTLTLMGTLVASVLQFFPITSTVRSSLAMSCKQCRDVFSSLLHMFRTNDDLSSVDQMWSALKSQFTWSSEDHSGTDAATRHVPECFVKLTQLAIELKDDSNGDLSQSEVDLGQILEDEMRAASRAVDEASSKFQELLRHNSEENSGVKLQVHSSLIASCSKLMNLIKQLMLAVKTMQQELVESGSESSSSKHKKEFYASNSSWTEGLISGGKSLGLSANMLVEAADAAMRGSGRFVAINACAKGIVSAIAHLVLATKVKQQPTERGVKAANQVTGLAKQVQAATGEVIAASQQAQSLEDSASLMDFSSLSLHQAKQMEMESHIKLMELEANVEKERAKLGDLRRHHYKLAAAAQQEPEANESASS